MYNIELRWKISDQRKTLQYRKLIDGRVFAGFAPRDTPLQTDLTWSEWTNVPEYYETPDPSSRRDLPPCM